MRKLVVSMNITLDGYLSGVENALDWHLSSWTTGMRDALCRQLAKADTILLGRTTHDAMAQYWPLKAGDPSCRDEDFGLANMMNSYAKIVFSKTIRKPVWNNTSVLKGNLQQAITKLKTTAGRDIIVFGSGQLTVGLIKMNLVNEYQLWIHPVILGKGNRLFKNIGGTNWLKMINCETFASGVVLVHYQSIFKQFSSLSIK